MAQMIKRITEKDRKSAVAQQDAERHQSDFILMQFTATQNDQEPFTG